MLPVVFAASFLHHGFAWCLFAVTGVMLFVPFPGCMVQQATETLLRTCTRTFPNPLQSTAHWREICSSEGLISKDGSSAFLFWIQSNIRLVKCSFLRFCDKLDYLRKWRSGPGRIPISFLVLKVGTLWPTGLKFSGVCWIPLKILSCQASCVGLIYSRWQITFWENVLFHEIL